VEARLAMASALISIWPSPVADLSVRLYPASHKQSTMGDIAVHFNFTRPRYWLTSCAVALLLFTAPTTTALEVSAGGTEVQANSALDMKFDATTLLLKAAIEQLKAEIDPIKSCNQAKKFYLPGDADA